MSGDNNNALWETKQTLPPGSLKTFLVLLMASEALLWHKEVTNIVPNVKISVYPDTKAQNCQKTAYFGL